MTPAADHPASPVRAAPRGELCGCITCAGERAEVLRKQGKPFDEWLPTPSSPGWRYACELCGNKRCPHHTNHTLECTGSNEPGQKGSVYE